MANARENPQGLWLTARGDATNQARGDVAGRMVEAPREVWRLATGGDVRFARSVMVHGEEAALVQAGSNLELTRWSGESVWRQGRLGVSQVLHVGDFDGDGAEEVCVLAGSRTVLLLDLATGKELWRWQSEPSTFVGGHRFYRTPTGIRFLCFPSYSLHGYCFDFSGRREGPHLRWKNDYTGKYGAGFGPSIVLQDMDGDGKVEIVLSGKIPRVYQAVLDVDTGAIRHEVYYDPDPEAPLALGRPYGLLHAVALDRGRNPDVVLISCQVEEYIGVARNEDGKRLEKVWGKFVEKDWPEDVKELRPQVTSLADLRGSGKIELVVGVWEEGLWRTLVIDPLDGYEAQRGSLEGCYFWGCHDIDGDGRAEIIVSREARRRTAQHATLLALSGQTLEPIAELAGAAVFVSTDSPLPDAVSFHAGRRNPIFLRTADGSRGILVRRFDGEEESGVFLWGRQPSGAIDARPVAGPGCARADLHENRLLLTDRSGAIQRCDENLRLAGSRLATRGRTAHALVRMVGGKREIVCDVAGGGTVGGAPEYGKDETLAGAWRVTGQMAAAHVDAAGQSRLAVADVSDPDRPAVRIYEGAVSSAREPVRIPLDHPPYLGLVPFGGEFRLLVNLQTGVHTMALACYDASGRLLWKDEAKGAHPRIAAAADIDGDGGLEVVADDHGALRIYDAAGAIIATGPSGLPIYTLPIPGPFGPEGEMRTLRAGGTNFITMVDGAAQNVWETEMPRWRHCSSLPAVGDTGGDGRLMLGSLAEDGCFECFDTASGALRWSLPLNVTPNQTSVIAGDVDGDGRDEFVLGLSDGRLVCLREENAQGAILWEQQFEAAVANPILADIDGDGLAEIVVATSDGYVRILKERGGEG